jgi:hypothetical protein
MSPGEAVARLCPLEDPDLPIVEPPALWDELVAETAGD